MCPILGPLVPLFWISGDVTSGFKAKVGCLIRIEEANVKSSHFVLPEVVYSDRNRCNT